MQTETPTLTLDSAELSQDDYRSIREGKTVPVSPKEDTPAADAAKPTPEIAAEPGTAETNLEEEPAGKPKRGIELRFAELTGEIKALQTQIALRGGPAVEQPKPAAAVVPVVPPDPNDPEPDAGKFTDYVEWQKQWNRWDRRQEAKAAAIASESTKRTEAAQTRAAAWNERVKSATTEHADFQAVALNTDLQVTRAMGDAITTSEHGTEILYRLGKDPAESLRISKLIPVSQVREIGKLEAAIEAEKHAAADGETSSDKTIKVSAAPPPIRPISGAAATASVVKNIDTMSQAEYRAYRESGKIR